MITEAIASHYTRVAERWMVTREVNNHSQEFSSGNSINSNMPQNQFEKRTAYSKFVVPKNSDSTSTRVCFQIL